MIAKVNFEVWQPAISTPEGAVIKDADWSSVNSQTYSLTKNSRQKAEYSHQLLEDIWGVGTILIQPGIIGFIPSDSEKFAQKLDLNQPGFLDYEYILTNPDDNHGTTSIIQPPDPKSESLIAKNYHHLTFNHKRYNGVKIFDKKSHQVSITIDKTPEDV